MTIFLLEETLTGGNLMVVGLLRALGIMLAFCALGATVWSIYLAASLSAARDQQARSAALKRIFNAVSSLFIILILGLILFGIDFSFKTGAYGDYGYGTYKGSETYNAASSGNMKNSFKYGMTDEQAVVALANDKAKYAKPANATTLAGNKYMYSDEGKAAIRAAAQATGLDPELLAALGSHESGWTAVKNKTTSAAGPLQVINSTAAAMYPGKSDNYVVETINGKQYTLKDIKDPEIRKQMDVGLVVGAKVLKEELKASGSVELALRRYYGGAALVNASGGVNFKLPTTVVSVYKDLEGTQAQAYYMQLYAADILWRMDAIKKSGIMAAS